MQNSNQKNEEAKPTLIALLSFFQQKFAGL